MSNIDWHHGLDGSGYVIVTPNGWAINSTFRTLRKEAIAAWMDGWQGGLETKWSYWKGRGYSVRRAALTVELP